MKNVSTQSRIPCSAAKADDEGRVAMPLAALQSGAPSDHPDWLPGEMPPVVKVGDAWRMSYGQDNQYQRDFPTEPAWCATNRTVKELLGESRAAWGLYREIESLKATSDRAVIRSTVKLIVDRIDNQSICDTLKDVFALRLRDEQLSSAGWGPAGGLCNMVGLYSEAIAACKARKECLSGRATL
jgi:hypothetical protein